MTLTAVNTRYHDQATLKNADVGLPYLNYQNTPQNDGSFLSFYLKVVPSARFLEVTILSLLHGVSMLTGFYPLNLAKDFMNFKVDIHRFKQMY